MNAIYTKTFGTKDEENAGIIEVFERFVRITANDGCIVEWGASHVHEVKPGEHGTPIDLPDGSIRLAFPGDGSTAIMENTGKNPALIRAIRAMKPADVSHMQNDHNGCGAAVVARLSGVSYNEAVESLFPKGKPGILGTQRLANATNTIRHVCKSRTWKEVENAKAIAVLIKNTDPRLGRHYGHYVSIDPGMVIVDPELVLYYPLAEYPRKAWTPLMYFSRT